MRDIHSPTGLHYRIHETPEDLAVLTPRVAQESEIWIDTETADWNTKSPRLSLVQLRLGDGSLHVLDVLSPEMAAAYHSTFAPRVIAAPRITKWAHYARFERRILGADFVFMGSPSSLLPGKGGRPTNGQDRPRPRAQRPCRSR